MTVKGVEKAEYLQSLRRMALRPYLWMWVIVAVVVALVALLTNDARPQSFLFPAVILLAIPLVYEIYNRQAFGKQPFGEVEMDYWLDERGWRMEAFGSRAVFTWANTDLVETRDDLLLYTDRKTSSLLPKRCLTPDQLAQVRAWAKAKR